MTKKYSLISLFFAATIFLTPTANKALELPKQLHDTSIYLQQRARFAKVMISALWKYARGTTYQYTMIEAKLAQIYGAAFLSPEQTIENDVLALYEAIEKNNSISISSEEFLL